MANPISRPALAAGLIAAAVLAAPGAGAQTAIDRPFLNQVPDHIAGVDFRLPASENLVLSRGTSVRSDLLLTLPDQPSPELRLQPSRQDQPLRPVAEGSMVTTAEAGDAPDRAGQLQANYRSSTYVSWLPTLQAAVGSTLGYAGTPGLHSRWSSEIDQWVAMLDQIRPARPR